MYSEKEVLWALRILSVRKMAKCLSTWISYKSIYFKVEFRNNNCKPVHLRGPEHNLV